MRWKITTCLFAAGALLAVGVASPVDARRGPPAADPVFAEGGVLAGSTNGMSFAPDGTLWVANVLGATITQIDPDSGEVLDRLTAADGVFFPDDVVVGPDGSIHWTDIGLGTVFRRLPDGTTFPLVLPIPGGLNSANPLTLSEDGSRLFAAGCYGGPPANNAFVELDPFGAGIINVLREDVPGCASNGMSWNDGSLHAPQPFTDEILRLDPDSDPTDIEVVTSGYPVPIGTAFDSNGDLHAVAQGVGDVVRIDVDDPDVANNRTVIAQIPVGWADNIAISDDDRIFVSSASDSTIVEVLPGGALGTVVPGQFQVPFGVATIGGTVYTAHISGLVGFDRSSREQTSHFRAAFGLSAFPPTTSMVAWGDQLVLMSALSGQISLWDRVANAPTAEGLLLPPTDAQPFRGDLIVTQGNGEIARISEDLVPVGTVASVPGAAGLARRGGDVYVTDHDDGTVLRIIRRGKVLATPEVAVSGLAGPEGLDIKGSTMYVVEGGSETLTAIDMKRWSRSTVATDIGLQAPTPLSAFGWFNDVTATGNDIYVNADRANVLYEF